MIAEIGLITYFTPFLFISMAVAMLVLRAGASRVFFDIVGTFQAQKLIKDVQAASTVFEALYMDAIMGIQEAGQELGQPFTDLLDTVMPITEEIEEARIEFEKFIDVTGDAARAVQDDIQAIGQEYGFAADEAFMASARMAQLSGVLGGGTIGVGTELGMQFGLISGMSTEAAMQRMINLQQQTKFMTENLEDNMDAEEKANRIRLDSIRVLDQLNTVENRSAATMEQITFVMNQFASQAYLTGESISAMAAMSATLIEAGEEQGKGGRALRMIYARLGANTNGARDAIESLGIAVVDAEENMKPFSVILSQLAERYETMSSAEQQQLAQSVAGNRHYTRLIKLLENVDRVRELEFEAIMAQFPAMDEIERRRDTELFQLTEARAKVKNYSGALGEELMPALTRVTNQQALYLNDLVAFSQMPVLGNMITGTIAMADSMRKFVGPVFNALVSIKNIQISMQTFSAIQRSLNGEMIAGTNSIEGYGGAILTATPTMQLYNQARQEVANSMALEQMDLSELIVLTDEETEAIKEKLVQVERDLDLTEQMIAMHAQEGGNKQKMGGHMRQANRLRAEHNNLNEKLIRSEMGRGVETRKTSDINKQAALDQAAALNTLSMQLGGAGMALTIFGKSQTAQRAGMMLNTTAMLVQIAKTAYTTYLTKLDSAAKAKNAAASAAQATGNMAVATTSTAAAFSITGLGTAMKALWASSGPMAIMLAGSMALVAVLDRLGTFTVDATEAQEDLNASMIDSGLVRNALVEYELASDINEAIAQKTKELDVAKKSQSALSDITVEGLNNEIAALKAARDIREFTEIGTEFDEEAVTSYFDNIKKEQEHLKKFGEGRTADPMKIAARIVNDANPFAEFYGDTLDNIQDEIVGFETEFANLFAFIDKHQVDNVEDLRIKIEQFGDEIEEMTKKERDALNEMVSSYNVAETAILGFNNSREELFYGFDRDNLTGDLVRQVNQQGVETLITTTEVIMTNIFNGLTIPEMADQIIDEIESRANKYNFA